MTKNNIHHIPCESLTRQITNESLTHRFILELFCVTGHQNNKTAQPNVVNYPTFNFSLIVAL